MGRINLKNLQTRIYLVQKNIIRFIKERRTVKVLHIFRNYSAFVVVLSSALLVSATNLSAGKESSGFLFGYFGNSEDNFENPIANKMSIQTDQETDLALVPLAKADLTVDPKAKFEKEEENLIMQDQSLITSISPVKIDPEDDGTRIYEVQSGDTVSGIAKNFGITVNTILWANEIDNIDSIKPGDKIFILPVAGLSYTAKKGDTVKSIAEKYKSKEDKIIAFNDLPANGEISEGMEIIIPEGQKEIPAPVVTSGLAVRQYEPFSSSGKNVSSANGTGHRFYIGQCTWYVASRRHIPWGGNAGYWLLNARSMGYATGKTPKKGSIVVTTESSYGHVALVEKVSDNSITISEMNYGRKNWNKVTRRTISTSSRVIKGYIY